jgi:hypothetical protein
VRDALSFLSSLRTQGPITTGGDYAKVLNHSA